MNALRSAVAGFLLLGLSVSRASEAAMTFGSLRSRAAALAASAPVPARGEVPDWLKRLSYDDLRRIAFDGRRSLWLNDGPAFAVQFLHPGFLFDRSVTLHEISGGAVRPLPFRTGYFNYHGIPTGEIPAGMGFAGFRLMYPWAGRGTPPAEIGSFAGASYFRFLPELAAYGLSARGLAIDTAGAGPEEFPRFSEFWLERPAPGDDRVTVLALLESESVTGAYRFVIAPGKTTTVDVRASLHFRRAVGVLGLAPLTSMFWRGEDSHSPADDFRPEVHDSDGLQIQTGAGEWIWRPLVNHRALRVATFGDEDPRGFGLLQRDRNFESYQDLEASYHRRPSVWVEPRGRWGRGGVRLVEIPTGTEFDDNVVAFWTPEKAPPAGGTLDLEYRLHWCLERPGAAAGRVRATRSGRTAYYEPGLHRFVVDFEGGALARLSGGAKVSPVVTVGEGAALHHASIQRNPENGSWRVAFTIRPGEPARPVELRCFIRGEKGEALTETWSHLWPR